MANAFDRFDTETETSRKGGNPFDAFDDDVAEAPSVQPEPVPSMNMGRGAVERGGDLLGGLFTAANAMAERGEEKYPLGGLVWEDGIIPDYMGPDEYSAWRSEKGGDEPLKTAADRWKNLDVGYVENHTWDRVKQEFSEGGALSGSAWAEVMAYGAEQGVKSIPDMVAAMAVLPTYVMARSGEIGEERARNKGKEEADLTDVLEAAPAALGSAILERIGAKGITEAGAEAIGKEALQQGLGKLAKEGVKAGSKEAATEFVQEGIIEYLGEKFGTDAAMSVWEALDRGAAGAVAGGVYGTGAGLGGAAVNQARGRKQDTETPVEESAPPVVQDEVQAEPLASTDDKAPVNDYYGRPDWANDQTNIFRDGTQPETTVAGNPFDVFDQEAPAQAEATPEPAAPATAKQPETSLSESGTGVFRVPVDQINVDPQQYQFRSRVNDQGVDKRLDGIKTWDDKRAGNVLLHRRKDGSLYVADGHHRVDLAKRLGQTDLNARLVDEADGVDVATARVEAAMNNIADGKAEPIDVAKIFRDSEVPTGEVRETFNLPNSQVVRDGESLSKLSDNVFGMVTAGQMSEKDGAAIGTAFAEQAQQEAAADAFQKVQPDTEYQRQLLVNEIRAAEFAESQGEQGGLFGDDPQEVSLMQDRLKVLDALRQRLNSDKRLFKSLNDNADRAGEAGNQIATEANESITQQSARTLDLIGRVTTTPALNEMVNRAARRVYDGENRSKVVTELKQELMSYEQGATTEGRGRPATTPSQRADAERGQESRTGQPVPEQDTAGADQSGQPESQQDEVTPALDLETQTEEQLAEQARARQETQQAESDQRRQEEQRARADEQVDGFTLTGSDRTADVAMAAGQDDMFVSTPASRQVEQAGTETETNPTDGQKEAGNYRKGRVRIQGLDIAIENPKGSTRSGTDPDGNRWESTMAHHYGDIKGTKAADGDNLDVFIGPYPEIDQVFVIDQPNADGSFDEHKVMLGFANEADAKQGYLDNYEDGWTVGPVTRMSMDEFKAWMQEGDTTKPVAEKTETAPEPTQPIEDFGEKIEGARKDYASKMAAAKEQDVAAVPLSKSWPEPNYQKMLDDGVQAETVALVRALRDEVPTKPQKSWKLKGWVEMVKGLRDMASTLMESPAVASKVMEQLRSNITNNRLPRESKMILGRMELYQELGHNDSFKGVTFGSSFYSLYNGKKDVTVWEVERLSKATSFGNMPRTLATGSTREEALDNLRKALDKMPESTKEGRAVRFNIYRDRYSNDVFIGKKIGKDVVRMKTFDDDVKAARKYLEENQQALEDQLEKMKKIPNHRKATNSPRVGVNHRKGADVTPEAFAETFGFRGVQFGNYVEQGRRQQDLNEAYDGLMDLAGILDIPAKALSLNGELGLAFGARGKGGKTAPKAHYEPGNIVINLTKKSGAGSLAHEWWHSLDNYFARGRGTSQHMGYATTGSAHISVRPEVAEAFRNIRQTVNRIRMRERSKKLDQVRTKAYWSTDVEMTARAFESYVIERLKDQDASNDYLANIVSEDYWKASEALGMQDSDSYPYPEAAEIPEVRAAYDNLFQVIETRQTESGNIEMYSRDGEFRRTPEYQRDALTVEQAESIRDELMNGWKGAPDVIVRDQIDQFPPGLQAAIRMAGAENDMRGVFWNDTVYILASRIPDRMRMEQVILHEVIGHYGLRKMLGKDMDRVLNQIWMAHGGQKRADFIIKRYFPGNTFDVNNKEHRHTVAEELIAHLAEQNRGQTLVQRAVAIIREGLRKLGFTIEFTVDDIVNLLRNARRTVERGGFETGNAPGAEAVAASRSEQEDGSGGADIPPNFRFSRAGVPDLDPQPFGPPSDTLLRKAISKIADKFTVLKGVQQNIQDLYGEIPESANAYRAEELFHGKVENDIRLIEESMVEPLAKVMSDNDVSLKQLDEFLYALHAPERNAVIAERNPEIPEGGSGMTDAEAAAIINKVEKSGKLKQYQALAKRVHDMLAMRRKILKNAGLLDEETVGAWEASYKNYVPLKGWAADEQQSDMPRIGKGFAIAGKESQMAAGRKSKAASPLANTISDLSEAVLRRRKNEVGNAFMNLVETYPNGKYWQVYTDENPEVQRKAVKVKDPETGKTKVEVREQTVPMAMMSDRYFTTKRDGKTYYIKIEDERLMNAMRNIGPDNSNLLVRSLAAVTRVMSSLNTSYNPEFVISNFSRDIQTALLNLTSEQTSEDGKARGKKIVAKVLKDTGTAIRAINASLKGKPLTGKAGKWQQYFEEFRKDGAKTGWFDMKDIDGQMKDLERMISLAGGSPVSARGLRRGFKAITEWVENTNSAIENGVRLSAYVNAIQAGIPRSQAASLAKNMTVNFNRKGELGTTMNALYMFANASIQGTANFVRTLGRLNGVKGDPIWQRMHTAQKIAAGMAMGGFTLSLLNRLVAGEDDDEVNWWDKVPDYVKERNIVIMKSLVGGEPGEYWTIPLPYGYNIFPVMGTQMEHLLLSENQTAGDAAGNVILAALGSFSPIGFEQSEEAYGVIAKNIMPTILRPVASISLNENFMGGPIFKENFPFGTQKPDSALYFRSTPEAFKALAEGLNDATGGSEFRSGAVDLSPDVMQFLVGYYGGGAYDFFTSRSPNFAYKLVSGVDLESREIPLIRKLSGKVLPYEDQSKFYDRRNEIQQLVDERKALKGRERIQFMRDYRDKLRLEPIVEATEKRLRKLREQRDQIELMDLSAAEEDERLQRVEKQMKRAIDQFNRRYNETD